MPDYTQRLRDAVRGARTRGWRIIGANEVRRTVEGQETPESIPSRWWPEPTYESHEFLSFIPREGRVPIVIYRVSPAPWIETRDRTISFKRALEILGGENDD